MNLKNAFEDVKKFHETFDHPVASKPQRLDPAYKAARLAWMREELDEFEAAETLEDEVDAIIDEIYFNLGTLVSMGVDPQPLFNIVQQANMAKVWPDGTVHRRPEDGKVVKPPGWQDPGDKLRAEIRRQLEQASE